jgi:hypothetical protein
VRYHSDIFGRITVFLFYVIFLLSHWGVHQFQDLPVVDDLGVPLFKELDRQLDALAVALLALEGLQLLEDVGFDLLVENMVNVPYLRVMDQAEVEIGELCHRFYHKATNVAG